jgi:hypothetical protein
MKKQALRIFTIASLFLAVTIAPVFAHFGTVARFNVPFDFIVKDVTLAAGVYTVAADSNGLLLIRDAKGHGRALVVTMAVQSAKAQDQAKLIFNRYGNRCYLSQIWRSGESSGRELYRPRSERKLAENGPKVEKAIVVAENR